VAESVGSLYYRVPRLLRQGVVAPLIAALPFRFRQLKIASASLACEDWRERYVRWFGALDFAQRRQLALLPEFQETMAGPPFDANPEAGALRRVLYFDQTSWLPDNLLERGDRMSMAASIEARLPFLDHKLVEFVSGLPDRWRVQGLGTKRVLRQAARSLLPSEILTRKKVGFRAPVDVWFAEGMRDYLYDHLHSAGSLTRSYYDRATLDRLLDEHTRGVQPHDKLLWTLLNLEIWHRQYCTPAVKEALACAA
jgi:asparagine synthase (glutamine-hydrolysing)